MATTGVQQEIQIRLENKLVAALPQELADLATAIEKSKYILSLEKDFDSEGAEPYPSEVWIKAIRFISGYAAWLFRLFGKTIALPEIYHAPESSIDIYWENERFNLLINIPADESPATFYGDDFGKQVTQGKFDPENFQNALLPHLSILA